MDDQQWQTASGPYMGRMLGTGRYPTLVKVFQDATHPGADVPFDAGLGYVLDGIASRQSG